jgi:RNA methyltransferase, TrmH family
MTGVASRDNPRYRAVHRLAVSAPARRHAGRTLIEGVHLCSAYLVRFGAPALCVLAEGARATAEISAIAATLAARDTLVLADALFRSISQLEQGVGIAFVVDVPKASAVHRIDAPAILIDRLQDPGNLGSILRSAAAAGIGSVFCSHGTVAAWSPKVLRAGMGAHFALSIAEDCALAELVGGALIPVFATSSHAGESLYDADLSGPVAWMFGNEGEGIAAALLEGASTLAIPLPGGMESLNVAAAAAICLFEGVRQGAYSKARATLSR